MKLSRQLSLDIEVANIFYDNEGRILIGIQSESIIPHCRDDALSITEFIIYTDEITEDVVDYDDITLVDGEYMDFYDYPILIALYNNYENFIQQLIPYIIYYAKTHNIVYKKKHNSLEDWSYCKLKEIETPKKKGMFKCLNKGW